MEKKNGGGFHEMAKGPESKGDVYWA
jgi:hypothetical protein